MSHSSSLTFPRFPAALGIETAMETIITERFEHLTGKAAILSEGAKRFRRNVIQCFLQTGVTKSRARKQAILTLFAATFNGDWRIGDRVQHLCTTPQCCGGSSERALQKLLMVTRLFNKTHRPSAVCKGNWMDWSKPYGAG